ncbi:MAG: hypothetical protein ACXABY_33790 [Candidatus Thorarchaeota archaeon]
MATLLYVLVTIFGEVSFREGWFAAIMVLDLVFTPLMMTMAAITIDWIREWR